MTPIQFSIDQLRKENLIKAVEAIAFVVLAFFITVYLPSLMYQFVFDAATLTEEPEVMKFIPVVSFAIATAYFLFALVGNLRRMNKIKALEKQLVAPASVVAPVVTPKAVEVAPTQPRRRGRIAKNK